VQNSQIHQSIKRESKEQEEETKHHNFSIKTFGNQDRKQSKNGLVLSIFIKMPEDQMPK